MKVRPVIDPWRRIGLIAAAVLALGLLAGCGHGGQGRYYPGQRDERWLNRGYDPDMYLNRDERYDPDHDNMYRR